MNSQTHDTAVAPAAYPIHVDHAAPSRWRKAALFVAAGLVSAALAGPASAQVRQEGGRALDANPRAGSGGRNDSPGGPGRNPLVTGNQIVTGNVTAGREFRGPTGYTDVSEFRAVTSGLPSDRFVRDSAGVPRSVGGIQTQIDMTRPQAFYGSQRVTPPPAGYVPTVGATGGYVASNSAALNTNFRARSLDLGLDSTARPGELILSTLDQANQQTYLSASPLQGVRVWEAGQLPNSLMLDRPGQGTRPGETGIDRFGRDAGSIQQMRDEMNRAAGGVDAGRGGQQGQGQQGAGQQSGLVQPLDMSLNRNQGNTDGNVAGQNQASAIRSDAVSTQIGAVAVGGESGQTHQSIQRRLVLVPAEKQTPQLMELRRQFERRHGRNPSDVEANREFNLEVRTKKEGLAKANADGAQDLPGRGAAGGPGERRIGSGSAPGEDAPAPEREPSPAPPPKTEQGLPNTPPGDTDAPATQAPAPEPRVNVPAAPLRITSMAENVQAKGLRDLLTSAEELMRQEKYAAALDKYNTAQEVAPNNPMIGVGRAHAELAASYYRRAETDLRDALAKAPELVEAQFDLKALIGADRLQVVVKDLKELAETDKTQARPLLLLAYIAYHTANPEQAATYLDAAQQRVQGEDALIHAWRRGWTLPASGETPSDAGSDLNK